MAYTGPYFFSDTTDYYIHKHLQSIGKAAGGKALSDAELYARFSAHKEQALAASKTQFKTLLKGSLSEESAILLSAAFEEDSDSILKEIDNQMKTKIKDVLAIDKLQTLMNYQKETVSSKIEEKLISKDSKQVIEGLNELLEVLIKAMNLLNGDMSKEVANALLILKEADKQRVGSYRAGAQLKKALSRYSQKSNGDTIEMQRVKQAVHSINALASALKKVNHKDSKITSESIRKLIDGIFNVGFAEGVASMMSNSASVAVDQSLAELTGDQRVRIQVTDEKGKPVKLVGRKLSGKADTVSKNVKISLDATSDFQGGEINIDLGISNKFYRTYDFSTGGQVAKGLTISSGSGGTVKEAIFSLFGSPIDRYLAYNAIARGDGLPEATLALNDLILTRQINRLFAARSGNADFAQFILANGEVVSIWELILYSERFLGYSSSQQKQASGDQAIVLSIPDRVSIIKAALNENTYQRVRETNQAISRATIQAHLQQPNRILHPWDFPGKSTGVGCQCLLRGNL